VRSVFEAGWNRDARLLLSFSASSSLAHPLSLSQSAHFKSAHVLYFIRDTHPSISSLAAGKRRKQWQLIALTIVITLRELRWPLFLQPIKIVTQILWILRLAKEKYKSETSLSQTMPHRVKRQVPVINQLELRFVWNALINSVYAQRNEIDTNLSFKLNILTPYSHINWFKQAVTTIALQKSARIKSFLEWWIL